MKQAETDPRADPSCNAAAALIIFVAIPALLFAPFGITYLFVGEWETSVLYVTLGICGALMAALALSLIGCAVYAAWKTLGSPIAQACQAKKDRWQEHRQRRMPEAG